MPPNPVPALDPSRPRLGLLALLWYLAAVPLFLCVPYLAYMLSPPTGDEPSYLVTAISLIRDGDVNEKNNYAQRDYLDFAPSCEEMDAMDWGTRYRADRTANTPGIIVPGIRDDCAYRRPNGRDVAKLIRSMGPLPPQASRGVVRNGLYTKHGLGLSVMIAPFYALGGRLGVMMFLVGVGALVGVNIWLLAFALSRSRPVAWAVWAALQFSAPLVCHSFLVFPAIPAALLVVYAYRQIRSTAPARALPRTWVTGLKMALAGTALGVLPWLHAVYFTLSGPLYAWFIRQYLRAGRERRPAALAAVSLPFVLLSALLFAYYSYLYGTPIPNFQDHDHFLSPMHLPITLVGMLFDQKYGLLIYAPAVLIALVGCGHALQGGRAQPTDERHTTVRDLMWLVAPYLLTLALYEKWWGEWCPPARYLVPILPLLAAPFALALTAQPGLAVRVWTAVLTALSVLISSVLLWRPHLMFNWQTTDPAAFFLWLGGPAADIVPALVSWRPRGTWLADVIVPVTWMAAVGALFLSLLRHGQPAAASTEPAAAGRRPWWEWVALSTLLLLALGFRLWAVDRIPSVLVGAEYDNLSNVEQILNGRGPGFFGLDRKLEPAAGVHLLSLAMRLEPSVFAVRWPAAVLGAAGLIPFYLLLRRAVAAPAALLAAGLLAADPWSVHFSRTGRFPVAAALCLVAAGLCIRTAVRGGRYRSFVAAGWWAAAGAYTGMAGHAVLPAVLSVGVLGLLRPMGSRRRLVTGLLVTFAATVLFFSPQLRGDSRWTTVQDRDRLFDIRGGPNTHAPWSEKAWSVAANFREKAHDLLARDTTAAPGPRTPMAAVAVDGGPPPAGGMLSRPIAVLVVLGLCGSLAWFAETWIWWVVLLVSFTLTEALIVGSLDGARALLVLPFLYLFVGISLQILWNLCARLYRPSRALVVIGVVALAASAGRQYVTWVSSPPVLAAFEPAVPVAEFPDWQQFVRQWTATHYGPFTIQMWKARTPGTKTDRIHAEPR